MLRNIIILTALILSALIGAAIPALADGPTAAEASSARRAMLLQKQLDRQAEIHQMELRAAQAEYFSKGIYAQCISQGEFGDQDTAQKCLVFVYRLRQTMRMEYGIEMHDIELPGWRWPILREGTNG